MLYNIVLVSAIQNRESGISYALSVKPLFRFPILPLSVITEHQTELPVLYSRYRGGSGWGMNEGAALRLYIYIYTHTHTHTHARALV